MDQRKHNRTAEILRRSWVGSPAPFESPDQAVEALGRAQNIESLLGDLLDTVVLAIGCEHAALYLYDARRDGLRLVAVRGMSPAGVADAGWKALAGHHAWVVRNRQPLVCRDVASDPRVTPAPGEQATGSLLAVPILLGDLCLGEVVMGSAATDAFQGRHLQVAEGMIRFAAVAVANARAVGATTIKEDLLDRLAGNAGDAVAGFDADFRITHWSSGAERLFGWTASEVLGQPVALLDDPSAPAAAALAARVRSGDSWTGETTARHREGHALPVLASAAPVADRHGGPRGGIAIWRDLSQMRAVRQQLQASEKLVALGHVAAGVVHDLANPLAYTRMNLEWLIEMLRRQTGDMNRLAPLAEAADEALEGMGRAVAILGDLRLFVRGPTAVGPVDVGDVVRRSVRLFGSRVGIEVDLEVDVRPVAAVRGDAARLGQVVVNLVSNALRAVQARPAGARGVRVSVDAEGDEVVVRVADNGSGIAPEDLERVFEPFFSRAAPGEGMGLGLAICDRIVREHRGRIEIDSTPVTGTVVRVRLPAQKEAHPVDEAEREPEPGGPRGRLLVVDDEPMLLRAYQRALGRYYDLRVAADGATALEMLRREPEVDAILCDLVMPAMDGRRFYEALAAERPDLARRIVFVTGATADADLAAFIERCHGPVLPKPATRESIDTAIRMLGRANADDRA